MSRRRTTVLNPPSSPEVFPLGAVAFQEESEWVRSSWVDSFLDWRYFTTSWQREKASSQSKTQVTIWSGTYAHVFNIMMSLALITVFKVYGGSSLSTLSAFCTYFSQVGLIFDNIINAIGKFVGEGSTLRLLSKVRVLFHVVGIPLLAIPVTEVAVASNVLSAGTQHVISTLAMLLASVEFLKWSAYDIRKLKLVDLRSSKDHEGAYLAGTLAYTSGKFLELVLPAVFLVLYEMIIGCSIVHGGDQSMFRTGLLLIVSAVATLLSCAIPGRPDIQLYGENLHGGMLFSILSSIRI
jgi:hypothetical protein